MKALIFSGFLLINVSAYSQQLVTSVFYNGPGNGTDRAIDSESDDNSFVYVTGVSFGGTTTKDDVYTVKYYLDPFGNRRIVWSSRFNDSRHNGNNVDIPYDISTDSYGNVYVCGTTYKHGDITTADYFVLKYNDSGTLLWSVLYNGTGNCYDFAYCLATDAEGNVYVTGASFGNNGTQLDYATVKYNSSGSQQWVRRYNGAFSKTDEGRSIAVDIHGGIYVTGNSMVDGQGYNIITIKYNSAGTQQWLKSYNGTGNADDVPRKILTDRFSNIIIGGTGKGAGTNMDFIIIKYNSAGSDLWNKRYNGSFNGNDSLRGIDVDIFGNIYVTGAVTVSSGNCDFATIRYGADGNQLWVRSFDGGGIDIPSSVRSVNRAYEPESYRQLQICVSGQSDGSGRDFYTMVYDGYGNLRWGERFNRIGNANDIPYSVTTTPNIRLLYVTGESNQDFCTVVYEKDVQNPLLSDTEELIPANVNSIAYPNPFNPETKIVFKLKNDSQVKIVIYDILGRIVSILADSRFIAGVHSIRFNVQNLTSGIYLYKIVTDYYDEAKKIIVMK